MHYYRQQLAQITKQTCTVHTPTQTVETYCIASFGEFNFSHYYFHSGHFHFYLYEIQNLAMRKFNCDENLFAVIQWQMLVA